MATVTVNLTGYDDSQDRACSHGRDNVSLGSTFDDGGIVQVLDSLTLLTVPHWLTRQSNAGQVFH